jgi:hypothetical protein
MKRHKSYNSKTDLANYRTVSLILTTFLIVFPKSGIKVGSIPITTGYIILATISLPLAFHVLRKLSNLSKKRVLSIFLMFPFQCILILSILVNGYSDLGMVLSSIVSLIFVPWIFVAVLGYFLDNMNLKYQFKILKFSLLTVSVYGIFMFLFRIITGNSFEIPFLTINLGDVGEDIILKHNDRGGILKLISTYNNGNIYGVCILMLLPIYSFVETSIFKTNIVKLSLVMTLSRTAWVGLILFEAIKRFTGSKSKKRNDPRIFVLLILKIISTIVAISLIFICLIFAFQLFGANIDFLFDKGLGGRTEVIESIRSISFLPSQEFEGISETVYISVAKNFGIIGFISFLLFMLSPLISSLIIKQKYEGIETHEIGAYKHHLILGLLLYLIVSNSDGALLYIPVMPIYWFLSSLYLSKRFYLPSTVGEKHD